MTWLPPPGTELVLLEAAPQHGAGRPLAAAAAGLGCHAHIAPQISLIHIRCGGPRCIGRWTTSSSRVAPATWSRSYLGRQPKRYLTEHPTELYLDQALL